MNLRELLASLPKIPPGYRRVLAWAGYPAWAVAMALLTLYLTLPRDRIKDKIESALGQDPTSGLPLAIGMDATIEDVSLTLLTGLGVKVNNVVLRSRPRAPGEKPARLFVDDTTVKLGLFGMMFNSPHYRFKGHALSGQASGDVGLYTDEERLRVEASGIVLTGVPAIAQLVGLPVEGTVGGKFELVAPKYLLRDSASGAIEVTIEDAVIGDGKTLLKIPSGDPFLSQGITLPRIRLGRVHGKIVIEKGHARIEDLSAHSPDVDVVFEGYLELGDPIGLSTLHGYLRVKPSDAFLERELKLKLIMESAGAMAKRPDGYLGFQVAGSLMAPLGMPSKDPPAGVTSHALPSASVSGSPSVTGQEGGGLRGPGAPSPVVTAPPMVPPPPSNPWQAVPPSPSRGSTPEDEPPPAVRANVNRALEELNARPAPVEAEPGRE